MHDDDHRLSQRSNDAQVDALQIELASERRQVFRLRTELDSTKRLVQDLRGQASEAEKLRADVAAGSSTVQDLRHRLEHTAQDAHRIVDQWRAEAHHATAAAESERQNCCLLRTQVDELMAVVTANKSEIETLRVGASANQDLMRGQTAAELRADTAAEELARERHRVQELEGALEVSRGEAQRAQERFDAATAEAAVAANAQRVLRDEVDKWKNDCVEAAALTCHLRDEVARAEARAGALTAEAATLETALTDARGTASTLQDTVVTLQSSQREMETQLSVTSAALARELQQAAEKAADLEREHSSAAAATVKIEELQLQVGRVTDRANELEVCLADVNQQLTVARAELSRHKVDASATAEASEALTAKLRDAETALRRREEEVLAASAAHDAERERLMAAVKQADDRVEDARADTAETKDALLTTERVVASLQAAVRQVHSDLAVAQADLTARAARVTGLEHELDAAQHTAQDVQRQNKLLVELLEEEKSSVAKFKEITAKEMDVEKQRVAIAEANTAEFEHRITGLRAELEAAQDISSSATDRLQETRAALGNAEARLAVSQQSRDDALQDLAKATALRAEAEAALQHELSLREALETATHELRTLFSEEQSLNGKLREELDVERGRGVGVVARHESLSSDHVAMRAAFEKVQEDVGVAQRDAASLREQLLALQEQCSRAERAARDAEELRAQVEEMDSAFNTAARRAAEDLAQAESTTTAQRQDLDRLGAQLGDAAAECSTLRDELDAARRAQRRFETAAEHVAAARDAAVSEVAGAQEELRDMRETNRSLRDQLGDVTEVLEQVRGELNAAHHRSRSAQVESEDERARLRDRIAQLMGAAEETAVDITTLRKQLEAASRELEVERTKRTKLKGVCDEWGQRFRQQKLILDELQGERDAAFSDRDGVVQKFNELYEQHRRVRSVQESSDAAAVAMSAAQHDSARTMDHLTQRNAALEQHVVSLQSSLSALGDTCRKQQVELETFSKDAALLQKVAQAASGPSCLSLLPLNVAEGPRRHPKKRSALQLTSEKRGRHLEKDVCPE